MDLIPWDDFGKILHGGQTIAKVHGGEEILEKALTRWVECTNVTDRQIRDSKNPNVRVKPAFRSIFMHNHLSVAQANLLEFDHSVFGSHWRCSVFEAAD